MRCKVSTTTKYQKQILRPLSPAAIRPDVQQWPIFFGKPSFVLDLHKKSVFSLRASDPDDLETLALIMELN
jgi:hypothetical protein